MNDEAITDPSRIACQHSISLAELITNRILRKTGFCAPAGLPIATPTHIEFPNSHVPPNHR